jgi:hypothetical protein
MRYPATTLLLRLFLIAAMAGASGCAVVGGIFKAGMAVGILVAVVIVVLVFVLFRQR